MKQLTLIYLLSLAVLQLHAQSSDSLSDKKLKEAVLQQIATSFEAKAKWVDSTVTASNKKIDSLNQRLYDLKGTNEKVALLQQRIKALEDKQKALDLGELNRFQANYESALINLATLEKEIKPFLLLNKTKAFYTSLDEIGNPMNYTGYEDWIKSFKAYVEKEKRKDATLQVTNNILGVSANLSSALPLTGAFSQIFFQGLSAYVNSIPKRKKEVREHSEKMFALTLKLSQFKHDRDLIDLEGSTISTDLQNLQTAYEKLRHTNFALVGFNEADYTNRFINESDAFKILDYLNNINSKTASYVAARKELEPKQWKDDLYYQMMDIQALKIRFGEMIFKLKDNISKYTNLMEKYKNDTDIKPNIEKITAKLSDMQQTFDKTFNASDYVSAASKMYKVN